MTLAHAHIEGLGRRDVRVEHGVVHSLHLAGTAPPAGTYVDLGGRWLRAAFCDPHVHLDKALTGRFAPTNAVGLAGAIDAHQRVVEQGVGGHAELVDRACRTVDRLVLHGVLSIRAHVNVGDGLGLLHLAAMREVQLKYAHVLDIQLVAMVHTPVTGAEGSTNREWLRRALSDVGADCIGGCPHLDPRPLDALAVMFGAAVEAGLPVDLHTDETTDPAVFSLFELARSTERAGWHGRVTASHCVSLSMQPGPTQRSAATALASAGVAVVALPPTNLFLNSVGATTAPPRGIAPVTLLRESGVIVAAGSDNLQDPFNPVGDADPLHTASLLVTAAHQLPHDALEQVSNAGRAVLGLAQAGVAPGLAADLVAVPADDPAQLIAECPPERLVYRGGRLVASTTVQHSLTL